MATHTNTGGLSMTDVTQLTETQETTMTTFEITLRRHDGSFCTYNLIGTTQDARDEIAELYRDGFYATFTEAN